MMKIPHYDMTQFRKHAGSHANLGDYCDDKQASAEHLLRFWYKNKERLYTMLGGELIRSREINIAKPVGDLCREMESMVREFYQFVNEFNTRLRATTGAMWYNDRGGYDPNGSANFCDAITRLLSNSHLLVEGRVPNVYTLSHNIEHGVRSLSVSIRGTNITLCEDQKIMKVLGKVAGLIDMAEEFEQFRLRHSQILNVKRITGTLHLSIHPLDFATASDNNNGWDSCMSWENEGCYRLGTVEMMNSPYILCAYVTGNNVMEDVGGAEWNSKKWRAWILVDKDCIFMNRQYPYYHDEIAKEACDFARELAFENLGWIYDDEYHQEYNYLDNNYYLCTNYMYNDFDGYANGYVTNRPGREINFSGEAVCMWCGDVIAPDNYEANTLVCGTCNRASRCVCCDDWLGEDDIFWGPDDQPYCSHCYDNAFTCCDHCDMTVDKDEVEFLTFAWDDDVFAKAFKSLDKESAMYKEMYNPWDPDEPWNCQSRERQLCWDCLESFGIDRDVDILEGPCHFSKYKQVFHTYLGYSEYYYTSRLMLNPYTVTFETAMEIFGISIRNESKKNFYRILWDHYTEVTAEQFGLTREEDEE